MRPMTVDEMAQAMAEHAAVSKNGIRHGRFGSSDDINQFDGEAPDPDAARQAEEQAAMKTRTDFSEDQERDSHGRFAGPGVGLEGTGKGSTSGVGRAGGAITHKGEGGTGKGGGGTPKTPKPEASKETKNAVADKLAGEMETHPFGFSWRPDTGHATTGIMVAEHPSSGSSKVIDVEKVTKESEIKNAVREYVAKHYDTIMKDPALHFGGWKSTDEKTGSSKFYLDIARQHPKEEREKAIAEGVRHNQIAVWDVDNSAEIKTGGTGE